MLCSFDIHTKDGMEYVLVKEIVENRLGFKKKGLLIMEMEECVDDEVTE